MPVSSTVIPGQRITLLAYGLYAVSYGRMLCRVRPDSLPG